jgi:hypothetical protein
MPPRVLVDANVIIEAVRSKCWPAITGGLFLETVDTCHQEVLAGSPATIPGYVAVTSAELGRLHAVHTVTAVQKAELKLAYLDADGLDAGEHDLLAHARARLGEDWRLCSPDKAAVRAAMVMGMGDRLVSLEQIVEDVGANARLRDQFRTKWLRDFRTRVQLGMR